MRYLSLVFLVFGISCGSIQNRIDEALISTKEAAQEIEKTSAVLREETLPAVKDVIDTWKEVGNDVLVEIDKASDIRQELEGHGNTLNMGMWVAIVLGGVLIVLFVVIIHHKLTAPKRHSKQLGHLLENGGADKILKALQPKPRRRRPVKKKAE